MMDYSSVLYPIMLVLFLEWVSSKAHGAWGTTIMILAGFAFVFQFILDIGILGEFRLSGEVLTPEKAKRLLLLGYMLILVVRGLGYAFIKKFYVMIVNIVFFVIIVYVL